VTVAVDITPILPHVTPVGAAITPVAPQVAAVTANITPVLPDVTRFPTRRRGITLLHVLPALALVLPDIVIVVLNVAPIAARVTTITTQVASVAAHFALVSVGIAGLLRMHHGGYAKGQREQRGDECTLFHGLSSRSLLVPVETARWLMR